MKKYLSLVKFSHTIFALPFCHAWFFYCAQASGNYFSMEYIFSGLAMYDLCQKCCNGFSNRYLDREIDAKKPKNSQQRDSSRSDQRKICTFVCSYQLCSFYRKPPGLSIHFVYCYHLWLCLWF